MSITTYTELATAVYRWTKRDDISSYIGDYIKLAEQRIYYGDNGQFPSKAIRTPSMQNRETGSTSGSIAFPTRYLQTINLRVSQGSATYPLRYVSSANFAENEASSDDPQYWTVLNNAIKTAGTGTLSYTHDYYAAFAPLTSGAPTNTLLTEAPHVYLFATCFEVSLDLMDDAMAQRFYSRFVGAVNAYNDSKNNLYGGGSLAVSVGR